MKKIFSFLLLGLVLSIGNAWADAYTEMYSADFTSVATHSYTQNKTFTLGGKSWTSSVSQVNGGVFYLGCNSTHAAKGILNNNSTFTSVVTALCSADATYNSNKTTAHAYALLFENAYDDVEKVSFDWAGGNNGFQVYLFGDSGSGYVLLGSTNYATSGASVAGSVEWTGSATNFTKFVIVARPGAKNSTATSKTLRAATFKIYKASGVPTVATPTFSPVGGTYTSAQNVTIACSTDGATIHYTLDGTDPTSSSPTYSSAIAVSTTTTIKAIAIADGYADSDVATAVYTIEQPLTTMDEIYAKAVEVSTTPTDVYITFNNWIVTGVKGSNAYVTDGTKGFIIYQSGHGFSVGDVLSGTVSCKIQLYNKSAEIMNITSSSTGLTVTPGGVPTIANIPMANLGGVNTGALVQYKYLSYDGSKSVLTDGITNIKPYNGLYSFSAFVDAHIYTVTGVYVQFNTTKEILPRDAADIVEHETADLVIVSPGYATYYNSAKAYVMPADCEGNVFTVANGLQVGYDPGDVVPAGEGLVIYTIEPGTKTLIFTDSDEDTYASIGENDLKGTDVVATTTGGDVYYGLSLNSASEANSVGFYWMAANGAAFDNGAHKAYLALSANQAPARYYLFNEESNATDIQNVEETENAVKFIENGKLYIQKNGVVYDAMGKTVR